MPWVDRSSYRHIHQRTGFAPVAERNIASPISPMKDRSIAERNLENLEGFCSTDERRMIASTIQWKFEMDFQMKPQLTMKKVTLAT